MPAYLDRFKYDIFVSHAWAGNQDPQVGDRKWANDFAKRLEIDLRGKLTSEVSVFIDNRDAANGDINREFQFALEDSALFVALVTPAFHRQGCFCLKEVDWFRESARPVSSEALDVAKRFFKVVSRPVLHADLPVPLCGNLPYDFFEGDPRLDLLLYDRFPIRAIDEVLNSKLRGSYTRLLNELTGYLWQMKQMQASRPVWRLFFGDTTCPERDRLAAELMPHETESVPSPRDVALSETEFERRTRIALGSSYGSVHLIDPAGGLFKPTHWQKSVQEIQLACALEVQRPNFRVIVWRDRAKPIANSELAEFVTNLWARFPNTESLEEIPRGFEYLSSHLKDLCSRSSGKHAPLPFPPGGHLYLHCMYEELPRLEGVLRTLYAQNSRVRLPVFEGDIAARKQLNRNFISEAAATLYYWGTTPDLQMFLDCADTLEATKAAGKRCLLGLDPNDFIRQQRAHPDWIHIAFPADAPEKAVAELTSALGRGGN